MAVPRARLDTPDGKTTEYLRRPEFLIVDGAPGLENAIAAVCDGVPVQRCTVHKHRDILAHGPERLHDEITADYNDMIYAATREEIEARRKAFIRKWRLKHRAVADSLQEAGGRLFTFTRLPPSHWRSVRTTNAIERLHEEFKRRIKTQTILPPPDTAAMLFWALLASGQINMRKVTVHRRFQTWCRDEVLRRVLTDVANELRDRGALNEEECFIDATFVMAKGAGRKSELQSAEKA